MSPLVKPLLLEAYWSAVAVAEDLGSKLVEFPGRHAGYMTNPAAFVRRLHEVLDAAPGS